ncbi:signal-induced proliferation-associated 1-like protein 3 [Bemisia tabaci]|uniref:signal-induced proliferation-associated 1-like protein 3 n=1 Tax=Bemisia tabaci TaxID=7038 RepID=UPI003B28468D
MVGLNSPDAAATAATTPGAGGPGGGGGGGGSAGRGRGGARERALQAVDYYNSVLRARVNSGMTHHRSNSSLELVHDPQAGPAAALHYDPQILALRREYGSHGSIDVIGADRFGHNHPSGPGSGSENFFALLQEYKPAVLGLDRSRGGGGKGKDDDGRGSLRSKSTADSHSEPGDSLDGTGSPSGPETPDSRADARNANSSPKHKIKFHRFWSSPNSNGVQRRSNGGDRLQEEDEKTSNSANNNDQAAMGNQDAETEDKQRRRAFAHYDCQSLTANLGYVARLRSLLLSRRRNTTTGASAASMIGARAATPEGADTNDEDLGDGRCNDLVESCPFFRNEMGGEEERVVSLTRVNTNESLSNAKNRHSSSYRSYHRPYHRPPLSYGVSILEFPPGDTHWKHGTCPYQKHHRTIESVDQGALYYRRYFFGQDHQNWFGMDENLGPVAISIKRERVNRSNGENTNNATSPNHMFRYRLLIRTSELQTLRGSVLEDLIPNLKPSSSNKHMNTKEVLEYVTPEIQLSCLRLGMNTHQTEETLLKLDEQGLSRQYKVGVMYCRAGQATEEEMYNNENAGPAFIEFLDLIGRTVRLKGFEKYKAGLDNKTDSTGLCSVYSQYQDCEIMFHVSTLLPFTPNNRQQLLRKRHIGNDIVTIVFQEAGALPFTPKNIRSQFQHVFIIIRAINPCSDNTQYRVAVTRSKEVPVFGPPLPEEATFTKSKHFTEFLLAKIINGENAAHRSDKFATMATRTRQEYLKDLVSNYSTNTLIETSQKFSMPLFSSRKRERWRPRIVPDGWVSGALCWVVTLSDSGRDTTVQCILAISADSLVLVETQTRDIVFVTPCKSILGWASQSNSLRIYYHQGECTTVHMREGGDRDELMEVVVRLRSVTPGSPAQELTLRRNPQGQLGFHVQPDGVVTQVETSGLAHQVGLRHGARLVEICKIAVSTLSHDQMVDLLKTSLLVTVTVIPPLPDGSPRRGCSLQNCKYTSSNYEVDYENLSNVEDMKASPKKVAVLQQAVPSHHRRRYERSFSPPRSSSSSGYGTGSSSKSFSGVDPRFPANHEGTLMSCSSGHSSNNDDRWYDLLEPPIDLDNQSANHRVQSDLNDSPPPPLPARLHSTTLNNSNTKSPYNSSHTKIYQSNSLPLSNNNSFSLSVASGLKNSSAAKFGGSRIDFMPVLDKNMNNSSDLAPHQHDFKVGEKVTTCLMSPSDRNDEMQRNLNHHSDSVNEYHLVTRMPKVSDYNGSSIYAQIDTDKSASLPLSVLSNDTDSERAQSEGSGTMSTSSRFSAKSMPGTPSSRGQSPRRLRDTGEARLRPEVASRSPANRHSANLNSTLQQDLMKLISPEYLSSDDSALNKSHGGNMSGLSGKIYSNGNSVSQSTTSIPDLLHRSKSRDNIHSSANSTLSGSALSVASEVILTMARPATVISNAPSPQPGPMESKLSKEERLSPRVTKLSPVKADPNLVVSPEYREDKRSSSMREKLSNSMIHISNSSSASDTGIYGVSTSTPHKKNDENLGIWVSDVAEKLGLDSCSKITNRQMVELQKHLSQLESRLTRETKRRLSLEDEVRSLRDENRRLQEESQNTAQQFRQFTNWFYQTIEKQQ